MKKLLVMLIGVALSLSFFSCGDADDNGGSSSGVTPVSAEVEAKTEEKGAAYSETVSLDLSKNPLTDEGIEEIKANPAAYLRQSRVDSSRSASTGADDNGLEDFTVTIKEITKVKIEFEITATTPNSDCSVMITAVIPAQVTEKKQAVIQLVTQVNVGEGAGTASVASLDATKFVIPTAEEVKGLILKEKDDDEHYDYYEFTEADGEIIVNKWDVGYNSFSEKEYRESSKPENVYTYNTKTGELKIKKDENDSDSSSESDISDAMNIDVSDAMDNVFSPHLVKVGDDYYVYEIKLARASGKDLDSTFTTNISAKESVKNEDENGKEITMANVTVNVDMAVTTTSAGAFTGAMKSTTKISFSSAYKKMMTSFYEEMLKLMPAEEKSSYEAMLKKMNEQFKDQTQSVTSDITGVYVNESGVLTVDCKSIFTENHPSYDSETGKLTDETTTEVEEFESEKAFYDGTNLYFAEKYEKVESLPEENLYY